MQNGGHFVSISNMTTTNKPRLSYISIPLHPTGHDYAKWYRAGLERLIYYECHNICIRYFGLGAFVIHVYCSCLWLPFNSVPTTTWWSHQMRTFFALLALCAWNSPVTNRAHYVFTVMIRVAHLAVGQVVPNHHKNKLQTILKIYYMFASIRVLEVLQSKKNAMMLTSISDFFSLSHLLRQRQ